MISTLPPTASQLAAPAPGPLTLVQDVAFVGQLMESLSVPVFVLDTGGHVAVKGRIDAAMLDQVLPDRTRHWPHMMCGPAPMLAAIRAGLADRGTPLSAIHAEIFEMV